MTTEPGPTNQNPISITMRPPSFQRRYIAAGTDDPRTLIALVSDEAYFVRRQALQNPHTPRWVVDLLVKAGATPDLRGTGKYDPDLDPDSLRRLAETGPWARQLVVGHPNTSAEVLAALKEQPSIPLRLTIAAHPNADENTLAALGCDIDDRVRARASENPKFPDVIFNLLIAAGSTPDMQGVTSQFGDLSEEQISQLADLGAWGRFLAARHPGCPAELLTAITSDPEWRVRSGLLDNPHTPESLIQDMLDVSVSEKVENIRYLIQSHIPETFLSALANHPSPEVRMALARHPAATPDILGLLATDGVKEIRSYAAKHPRIKMGDIELMVRAGSTPDLMGLSEPDPGMTADEIQALLDGGVWARQLAVRHPNTGADTLARLLCDREPKIREWAAVHPNLSNEIKRELIRAGSGTDFQGIMPADPGLPPEALYRISQLGSWGEWVVANNPHAPAELLDTLGESDDWQVRLFVAKNPGTSAAVVARLRNDAVEEVCQAAQSQNRSERR